MPLSLKSSEVIGNCTLSASAVMVLDYSWLTKNIGIEVEYREYMRYLMFILLREKLIYEKEDRVVSGILRF